MAWFEIQKDPITQLPSDVELELYGNDAVGPVIRRLYLNQTDLSIFDEQTTDNSELRVFYFCGDSIFFP